MFSTWDLVRPRFWYPMSSLEQSMMDLEHMSNLMSRSRFPFDMGNEMLAAPSNVDDDELFRDLPVLLREQRPRRGAAWTPTTRVSTKPSARSARPTSSRRCGSKRRSGRRRRRRSRINSASNSCNQDNRPRRCSSSLLSRRRKRRKRRWSNKW
ncbi:uncharacterized protein PITG_10353 [Phytophthora infestans T30-4]|uniref:Uncharacterized protein n=1 Tax=Phytophthora infestans (strain T30-4) TaxID=403677 RepID=D0NF46_PHYIT|nr:uncharacterized protein PITG_10353 [Phytophthora infestans T30-4]EEY56835.1 conserved hypothetical protein [Phytophthora infestans T30-4]|eukprot:XP_002902163.1 conserved hypothetical protein [Phytophthora infestans T30-4]